jgi:iron complex transport system ATP-binding protein
LSARDLAAGYGQREVVRGVSFSLERGTLTALIGPNGCGKTTLLHALCGVHREASGEIRLLGTPLAALSRREVARRVALVSQFAEVEFAVTVEEAVALGRYPWVGPLAPLARRDVAATEEALAAMDLLALRRRNVRTLSGGERQRVFLARALAQDTPILLLDEPVASLDLRYQQETYQRLRGLAEERGVAILVTDHHLNLVAATCGRLLVIHQGGLWAAGSPDEIVTEEMIRTVFGARMRVQREGGGIPQCVWEF